MEEQIEQIAKLQAQRNQKAKQAVHDNLYNKGYREACHKICKEIDQAQYAFMADKDYDEGIRFGLMLAYQITDKCRVESEGKDGIVN